MKKKSVVNLNSKIYYQGKYWNDIPMVLRYMSKNFTGDPHKWWTEDFMEKFGQKPFKHALFLNCGDGRHEIEFYDKGIAKKITAFDISPELVKIANSHKGRRRIKFIVADANKIKFKKNEFDLVVNVAALHHVQYINRLCREIANALTPQGLIVNFDYVGSHRNQYSLFSWVIVRLINKLLPKNVRKGPIGYPHIPTMLATDPTEAIHSELIEQMLGRYFKIVKNRRTGGGVAYDILTHNNNLNKLKKDELNKHVSRILFLDRLFVWMGISPNLFSYIIAMPNKKILTDKIQISTWQSQENMREEIAYANRGVYGFKDYCRLVLNSHGFLDRAYLISKYIKNLPKVVKYNLGIYD